MVKDSLLLNKSIGCADVPLASAYEDFIASSALQICAQCFEDRPGTVQVRCPPPLPLTVHYVHVFAGVVGAQPTGGQPPRREVFMFRRIIESTKD